jgi:hypothetical protein
MMFRRVGSSAAAKLKDKSGMFYSDQPVPRVRSWREGSRDRTVYVCFDVAMHVV